MVIWEPLTIRRSSKSDKDTPKKLKEQEADAAALRLAMGHTLRDLNSVIDSEDANLGLGNLLTQVSMRESTASEMITADIEMPEIEGQTEDTSSRPPAFVSMSTAEYKTTYNAENEFEAGAMVIGDLDAKKPQFDSDEVSSSDEVFNSEVQKLKGADDQVISNHQARPMSDSILRSGTMTVGLVDEATTIDIDGPSEIDDIDEASTALPSKSLSDPSGLRLGSQSSSNTDPSRLDAFVKDSAKESVRESVKESVGKKRKDSPVKDFTKGDMVVVHKAFNSSDSAHHKLTPGMKGRIKKIKEGVKAKIKFETIDKPTWIKAKLFTRLRKIDDAEEQTSLPERPEMMWQKSGTIRGGLNMEDNMTLEFGDIGDEERAEGEL